LHPILLLVLLVGALAFISWAKRQPPAKRQRVMNQGLVAGLVLVLGFGLLTGRLHPLFAALGALVPIGLRAWTAFRAFQALRGARGAFGSRAGPSAGQSSTVETRFLRMELDHDTGDMDGVVLEGESRGRRLSQLDLQALLDLLARCQREDQQSAAILEAYLDRMHGERWQAHSTGGRSQGAGAAEGPMSRNEATQVLGISAQATREEIIAAHRRLMQRFHPDRGGSSYLAAKINQAKDLLLG
jgi:hypothetical protein